MGEFLPPEERTESSLFYLITCSKCHRLMDSPRELDCGHIFCEKCLPIVPVEKPCLLLRQFSVVCLECGKYTHIQGKEVKKLPVASWVQILKNYLRTQERRGSSESCTSGSTASATAHTLHSANRDAEDSLCSGCKSPSSRMWCRDCDIPLCGTCAENHLLLRKMKEHLILNKADVYSESRKMLCPEHKDPIKWLCDDCPRLLCFQCIHQKQCADHNYENISNIVRRNRKKVQDISAYIEDDVDKLSDFQRALSLHEESKNSLFEEYQDKIVDNIDQTIQLLQNAKSEMLAKIENKRSEFDKNLAELRSGITDRLKDYDNVKDVIQTVSQQSHQMELVLACPLLEKRVNTEEAIQYKLGDHVDDFNLIFKKVVLETPDLLVKPKSLSPRRSPRLRGIEMKTCSIYGMNTEVPVEAQISSVPMTKLTPANVMKLEGNIITSKPKETLKPPRTPKRIRKTSPEFSLAVPPPLPDRTGLDEVDRGNDSDTSLSIFPSVSSDSGNESLTPEALAASLSQMLQEEQPVCNSIIENPNHTKNVNDKREKHEKGEKKRIDPKLMPAELPPPAAHMPLQMENSIFYLNARPNISNVRTKTPGYAVVDNSECAHPLPPSDKPINWDAIPMTDSFEAICLPNGNVVVSFENGVKMFDTEGELLKDQTILGAKGMAYRPMKRDILVAGYHSNSVFALHDISLTFKADLKVTMKKTEKPWGCAALSNGGFVILYSKDDKSLFLDFYDDDDKFVKSSECGLSVKGPLRMTTDARDLIFISDELHDQIVICYPTDNYIQTVIVDSPRGMASVPNERGIFFASNNSICQLKLSPRDGRFSEEKVADLSVDVRSVTNYNDQFICLTDEDVRLVPK